MHLEKCFQFATTLKKSDGSKLAGLKVPVFLITSLKKTGYNFKLKIRVKGIFKTIWTTLNLLKRRVVS
jgi:hypothetical protein